MPYRNNYNPNTNQRHYQDNGYYPQNRGYNQNQGYNNNNQTPPKKSGVVYSKIKKGNFEGATIVNAWNKSAKGLITAKVAPYHKSDVLVTSEKGNEYMKMMCELTYTKTGQTRLIPCLMNLKTQKIVLSDIGMMISPNGSGTTSSGKRVSGYFGTMFKK